MDESKYKWIAIGIAAILLIWVIYKVLFSVGLIKTSKERDLAEQKDLAQLNLMAIDYFKPSYYVGKKVSKTVAGINILARTFRAAVENLVKMWGMVLPKYGFDWGTNNTQLSSVFSALKYKADVSFLANAYQKLYGEDLRQRLIDELDKTEMVNLLKQLNELK